MEKRRGAATAYHGRFLRLDERGGGELQADKEYSNVSHRLFCSLLCIGTGRLRDSGDNLHPCRLRYYLCRPCADQDREENNCHREYRNRAFNCCNILSMKNWKDWAIVVLAGGLIFAWAAWPSPSADERVKVYQQVIQEQEQVIDSLQSILLSTADSLLILKDLQKIDRSEFDKKISRLRKQIKANEKIHSLPTHDLDSIVRRLYGQGAI